MRACLAKTIVEFAAALNPKINIARKNLAILFPQSPESYTLNNNILDICRVPSILPYRAQVR